jgi:hypothetical protein
LLQFDLAFGPTHDQNAFGYQAMSKSYRQVDFVSNGWGGGTNYNIPGPMGNQFATPFGDPYRIDGVGGFWGTVGSTLGNIGSGIGKIITPLLPVAVPIAGTAVAGLLTKSPSVPTQQSPQSGFTVAQQQAFAQQQAAAAEKSNTTVHLIVGGAALVALFYFISRRK